MGYLDSGAERAALAALPLDARLRGVPEERIVARLKGERGQALTRAATGAADLPVLGAFVLVERAADPALARTLASLALQSDPSVRCTLLPGPNTSVEMLSAFLDEVGLAPSAVTICAHGDPQRRQTLAACRYATFLRHGDRLSPSAAAWLAAGLADAQAPDVVAWGEHQPRGNGRPAWLQRNPALHRISLLHFPYLRNAFAVRGALAGEYPGDLGAEALDNELHLFQLWLAGQPALRWHAHPEYFLMRDDRRAKQTPLGAGRRAFGARAAQYAAAFEALDEFDFAPNAADAPAPYTLRPKRAAQSISVVIPFRDRPELTLNAARSVLAQSAAEQIELVLVDNQSTADSLRALEDGLRALSATARWRIVPYPHAFNHSAQCNLGVRESTGEVMVFLNNDCTLVSADALEQLCAWALADGVATAGAAIREPGGTALTAGFQARLWPAYYFDSIVVERSEPDLAPFVRETLGNTFALAAVSRKTLDALGPLDAARFPNGFNDVEFACRALRHGYKHVTLGHVVAEHAGGASRARADEAGQVLLLRALYPEVAGAALNELRFDEVLCFEGGPRNVRSEQNSAPYRWWFASVGASQRPMLSRMARRISQTQWARSILANPTAYALIRRVYKRIVS